MLEGNRNGGLSCRVGTCSQCQFPVRVVAVESEYYTMSPRFNKMLSVPLPERSDGLLFGFLIAGRFMPYESFHHPGGSLM